MTISATALASLPDITHWSNSPSSNTQKPRLAENHIIIDPTIRERLEPYPLGCARPTTTRVFRIRRTQRARLRRSDGSHARRVRCIGGRRRWEVCEVRERGEDVCTPEEAFAVAEEAWVGARRGMRRRPGGCQLGIPCEGCGRRGTGRTPPPPSRTTSTKPPLRPRYSSACLYNVPRLTPFCSRL
jgi:hypothetical protein